MVPVLNETFLLLMWLTAAACGLVAVTLCGARQFALCGAVWTLSEEAISRGVPQESLASSLEQRAGPTGPRDFRAVPPGVRLSDSFESDFAELSWRPAVRRGSPPLPTV